MTAATLNTLHNLSFYLQLMAEIRAAIEADRFPAFLAERLANLAGPVGELG
jgi:queuine tRNA-ribosyltransferase